ncbi:MAG: DUF3160 domain-containing protein [Bacteroidia bacterium]
MKRLPLLLLVLILACSKSNDNNSDNQTSQEQTTNPVQETSSSGEQSSGEIIQSATQGKDFMNIDMNQSLDNLSLEEVRILRNAIFAQKGYLFNKAELRGFFNTYSWYDSLTWERWENADGSPLKFTPEEEAFIARAKAKEDELLKQNFSGTKVNVNNIINSFQFKGLTKEFLSKIGENGFLISPNNQIQLFHVYEKNDYQQVPSFVTTDLFLQVYHMYFSYLLRRLEEGVFFDKARIISEGLYKQALADYTKTSDKDTKAAARFNTIFFAVANKLLGGNPTGLPGELKAVVDDEYKKSTNHADDTSEFLGYPTIQFPYSLFKPRGHYTRSDTLQKYFHAMMWLQKGEMCMDSDESLKNAIYMANILQKSSYQEAPF